MGVTPYAAIQAQSFRTPGYSETEINGGGFGLAYCAQRTEPAANWAPASTASWRSIPALCSRCARGSPGRTTG